MNKQGIGLWIVVCALLVLDIGVHCVKAQTTAPNVVRAQELQILDSHGKVAIDLTAHDDKSGVVLYDSQGEQRVFLTAADDGGRLTLADENSHPQLRLDGSANPSVTLRQNNNLRAALRTFSNDEEALQLYDGAGQKRAALDYKGSADIPGTDLELYADDASNHIARMSISDIAAHICIDSGNYSPNIGMDWEASDSPNLYLYDSINNWKWEKKVPGKPGTDPYCQ